MRRRILVVDDDRSMVETLCDILELRGWETIRAYDGADAVDMAKAHAVDVVLMDVCMPRVDGVQALREIKANRVSTRVMLMTAYAAHDLLAQAERDGVLCILPKPVDLPLVLSLLDDAVSRARSVLVVDDDADYLRTMSDLLAVRGIATTSARSVADALTLLEREPPGAVLLDLKLDGVDASSAIVAIKEISPSVLLVLHSGYEAALHDAVDQAPPGLVTAAFTKPLPVERLLELLDVSVAL